MPYSAALPMCIYAYVRETGMNIRMKRAFALLLTALMLVTGVNAELFAAADGAPLSSARTA